MCDSSMSRGRQFEEAAFDIFMKATGAVLFVATLPLAPYCALQRWASRPANGVVGPDAYAHTRKNTFG